MTEAKNINYLDEYIDSLKSQSAKNLYRINLNLFFKVIEGNPETYFIEDEYGEPTTNPNIPYKRDIITFYKYVGESKVSSSTMKSRMDSLKGFLDWGETELSKKFWKKHRYDSYVETQSAITSKDDWRTIISNATYPLKTILLIALSSGCRINEILQLNEGDYYKDENPPRLFIRGGTTKKKHNRVSFLTSEATKSLDIWLTQKDRRIRLASKKHFGKKLSDYDMSKIFPYDYNTIKRSFNIVCDAVGFDDVTMIAGNKKKRKYHIHLTRGYAKSRMRLVMNEKYMNLIIGHKEYMSSYDQYTIEAIGEDYKKAISSLMIFTEPTDKVVLETLEKERLEMKKQIKELQDAMALCTEMDGRKQLNDKK